MGIGPYNLARPNPAFKLLRLSGKKNTRVSMEVIVTIVSKLGDNLLAGRIQPTFIGVIIH